MDAYTFEIEERAGVLAYDAVEHATGRGCSLVRRRVKEHIRRSPRN